MPKTEFLQIRLSPNDRDRVFKAAYANHLEPSTWARQTILRAVEKWEAHDRQRKATTKDEEKSPKVR